MEVELQTYLHILVDNVPDADKLADELRALPVREQLKRVAVFVRSKFKNVLSPQVAGLPPEEKHKVERVLDQNRPRLLSEALQLGYGLCVEYHVLAKVVLDKLGVTCEFQAYQPPDDNGHTYLDVLVDGQWEIFDPYAEVFLRDRGMRGRLLPARFYQTSRAVPPSRPARPAATVRS